MSQRRHHTLQSVLQSLHVAAIPQRHNRSNTVNKQNQKHIARAAQQGRGALLRTLAIIHRCSTTRTQREIEDMIHAAQAGAEFSWVNGAILHDSERA